ncbi:MAG: hypothetical protein MJ109_01310 [Kiritimatiellae bacterium]|nr:hypothetical protein [Kiritimatiellia bacterium]
MKIKILFAALFAALSVMAQESEIKVDLRLDSTDFLIGERIRGVVDIANYSSDKIDVSKTSKTDRFFIEVYRASDMYLMDSISKRVFVADFSLESGEGQKLETFLADHYALKHESKYLARPVLVHRGIRYEGMFRAFDLVKGIKVAQATQLFANRPNLRRDLTLYHWMRCGQEHLFLGAQDSGDSDRAWATRDLGPILRIDKPTISVLKTGEVIILHRLNADQFVRSEFWSIPDQLMFRTRTAVQDPETAGTQRVRELYKEKSVAPKKNPWYKFW